ncbi:divalent metal cation transporter [Alteraurantiacibacter aestuarii]|uniref:NRAMP family divalent metal transporter n=1 Tax=Alteraurantiacibacter aestuarii TaxID=650004 RepID=UPI0031D62408
MKSLHSLRHMIGPGLIFSGAAIGTSHLVQSTRAGAMFGAALIGVIVLVNFLKYPAYRFGVDYSHTSRRSLLSGYRELGKWAPILFLVAVAPLVPIILAALGAATAGIISTLIGTIMPVPPLAALVLLGATLLLVAGGYSWLDRINGYLLVFLVISTLITTIMVVPRVDWGTLTDFSWTHQTTALLFIVALAGFMPNPLDVSVALSLWKVESDRSLPEESHPSLRQARASFMGPYALSALMAVCFCIMGAGVMHAQSITPLSDAPGFAGQLVNLYREALGPQAAILAAIAALSVMLTTVIAGIDAYARIFASAMSVMSGKGDDAGLRRDYVGFCLLFMALASSVLFTVLADFSVFLDFVTSSSFVIAPVVALLNHLVVTRCAMPDEARPGLVTRAWSWLAILVMAALAVMYFVLVLR